MWRKTFFDTDVFDTIYYNDDKDLWCWNESSMSKWVISATLGRSIFVTGTVGAYTDFSVAVQVDMFNNQLYYYKRTGGILVWYSSTYGWLLNHALGTDTVEWWKEDHLTSSSQYEGNEWYTSKGGALIGDYYARGVYRGTTEGAYEGDEISISYDTIEGWESSTLFGEYTPITGSSVEGNKYFGWKKLTGDNNLPDLIATDVLYSEERVFAGGGWYLWYDGTDWILSNAISSKSITGYWKGATPPTPSEATVNYNLVYEGEEKDRPEVETYTLTFDSYVEGEIRNDIIIGQLAIWV